MATQKQLVGAEDCIGINFPAKRRLHRKLQRCLKNAKNIAAILLPLGKSIAWLITLLLNSYLLWHELRLETTSREGYPIREGSGVSTKSAPASGHSR